jgi:hypothetical protein
VPSLESLISRASQAWDPALERAIFGTGDPATVAALMTSWLTEHCGPVAEAMFYRPGVGVVAGLWLADGAEVVIKVHRWNVSIERLTAIQQVQTHVAATDRRAPRPLAGPAPLGHGIATVEELRTGTSADGRDPDVRRHLAEGLHACITAAAPLVGTADVGRPLMALASEGSTVWGEPHDVRFDFGGSAEGAEWIDDAAMLARSQLSDPLPDPVIGHFDWRVQNLAFAGTEIVGIYDWDSLALAPEAVVVGSNAAQFTADWSSNEPDPLPTVDEMRSFVADYERARQVRFSARERSALNAANLYLCAYGARCQHSDAAFHPELIHATIPPWIRLLRERGADALLA